MLHLPTDHECRTLPRARGASLRVTWSHGALYQRARRLLTATFASALLAAVSACGGDSGTKPVSPIEPPTVTPGTLASVSITLADPALQLGQTTQATVTGRDAAGATLALGTRPVTWSSSNVAVATVSGTGVVSAVGIGTANVQVSIVDGGATRTASATITGSALSGAPASTDIVMPGLTFSPFQAVVKQGGTVRFIFPTLIHNVIWDPRLTGQPAAPADINNTASATISRTFPSVGVFAYKCTLHPGMDGTIIVSP